MKKIIKIFLVLFFLAVAILGIFRAVTIATPPNSISTYFYVLNNSGFSDEQFKQNAISEIWIIVSSALNAIFSFAFLFIIFLFSYKGISIEKKLNYFKNNLINNIKSRKESKKNQKIAKMKAKIEKMESDE